MADSVLPTVDLSSFFKQGDEDGQKKAMIEIEKACSEYGFFLAINHGVPLELISQALHVSKSFYELPDEEKLKYSLKLGAGLPTGYFRSPENAAEKNEHFFMDSPTSPCNNSPPPFQQVSKELYPYFTKLGLLVESIINECLGLPLDFLKEYNNDRSWDFLMAHHYPPASETDQSLGKTCHSDGNIITFVFTDGVEGLEVYKDGKWIPINPPKATLVVNIGDTIQVLSNDKFKSAAHRVVRAVGRSRYSYAYFYSIHGDKLVEPLPYFTMNKGDSFKPKYKGFLYKEYVQLRIRNRTHPPATPHDLIGITHYAISHSEWNNKRSEADLTPTSPPEAISLSYKVQIPQLHYQRQK